MRGVYAIKSTDGRAYVGSSINVAQRWARHRHELRHNRHQNPLLQDAWSALGEEAFAFVVLEEVPAGDLIEAEQRWIDCLGGEGRLLNRHLNAGSAIGVTRTKEVKARLSVIGAARWADPAFRARHSVAMKGRMAGERHGRAKLNDAKVLEIRKLSGDGVTGQRLAAAYGVSQATISSIVLGQAWRHLLPFEEATQPEQKEAA